MENSTFTYEYSATGRREIEDIRRKYIPREETKLEVLKRLARRAELAGVVESLSLGIIGVLIFGIGMCFFLEVFAAAPWIAALFMVIGTLIMLPAYPLYKWLSGKTRAELAPEILRLSEEILMS